MSHLSKSLKQSGLRFAGILLLASCLPGIPVSAIFAGTTRGQDAGTESAAEIIRQFAARNPSVTILAAYMPWFGESSHIDVGYSSHDVQTLNRQIEQARGMGISGFVADWNGTRRPFKDEGFHLLEQAARDKGFKVALLYNESEDADHSTDDAIRDMDEAYARYIGPDSKNSSAYLTYEGQPVIFIFPKGGRTDWNQVRAHVSRWAVPPLLFYENGAPQQLADAFDGFFAWVHPGPSGWAPDGSRWGQHYLQGFYAHMKQKYPGKLMVGGAWAGFNDVRARWSENRRMNPRCGETLKDTLAMAQSNANGSNRMAFVMIDTWNDYEEGTAIEQLTFSDCAQAQ